MISPVSADWKTTTQLRKFHGNKIHIRYADKMPPPQYTCTSTHMHFLLSLIAMAFDHCPAIARGLFTSTAATKTSNMIPFV